MDDLTETLARFCEAWNRHDAEAMAMLWTEDGELNHPWGYHAVGRDAIRKLLAEEHQRSMAASQLRILRVTPLSGGRTAVAEVQALLDGVAAPNGRRYALHHTISAMFVANGPEWRIRTMTPLPAPRGE